jgi:hypothetical protein
MRTLSTESWKIFNVNAIHWHIVNITGDPYMPEYVRQAKIIQQNIMKKSEAFVMGGHDSMDTIEGDEPKPEEFYAVKLQLQLQFLHLVVELTNQFGTRKGKVRMVPKK